MRASLALIAMATYSGCTAGPRGDPGPTGSQGPKGDPGQFALLYLADGGLIGDGSAAAPLAIGQISSPMIADGAIVRGKLARESVLPENRGRGNSVRSFALSFPGPTGPPPPQAVYTVPAGKTFILTDAIVFHSFASTCSAFLELRAGTVSRAYLPSACMSSTPVTSASGIAHFEAGIRFDSGETITAAANTLNMNATLSGYEF